MERWKISNISIKDKTIPLLDKIIKTELRLIVIFYYIDKKYLIFMNTIYKNLWSLKLAVLKDELKFTLILRCLGLKSLRKRREIHWQQWTINLSDLT